LHRLDIIPVQACTPVGPSVFWIGPPVHHLLARLQHCPPVPRVAHLTYLDDMQRCKCNAIKGKTWLGNHLSSKHNKQTQKATGLVLQHESSIKYFSLKCFLQKVWLTWLGRLSINLEQKEVSSGLYLLTSKHKQST